MLTPSRAKALISWAFPAMVSLRVLGAALSPLLFAHLPILLVVMSPFLIHLIAVAPLVSPLLYFPVAFFITTLQSLVGFFFGSILGRQALEWLLARLPFPESIAARLLELVRRASLFAIFAIPGPILGTIAGVAGVNRRLFFLLVGPAQLLWITAAYFIGEALLDYIAVARGFVSEHAPLLTAITVSAVSLRLLVGYFRRDKSTQEKRA